VVLCFSYEEVSVGTRDVGNLVDMGAAHVCSPSTYTGACLSRSEWGA
jgi:hypothetical protein